MSLASGPKGIPLDSNSLRRVADKHGHLQCNNAALDEIESVVISDPIVVKAGSFDDLSIAAPEVLSADESLLARIASGAGRRSIVITVRDENGRVITEVERAMRRETIDYQAAPLSPGGYNLQVRDVADVSTNGGVHSSFLVWPE